MFEVHQPLGILLQICHQGRILFITGMKLAIYQHLICGVTPKRLYCRLGFKEYLSFGILFLLRCYLSLQTELLIEPRYPMFGGWRTSFTIGYGLPLQDFLYESERKRFLNITFSSPMVELVIDTLIVKVGSSMSIF